MVGTANKTKDTVRLLKSPGGLEEYGDTIEGETTQRRSVEVRASRTE